ncbi:MAG: hypothetical protein AVDCRST_MAG40-410, partial [uncultured Gemmatimonadaceae bacterium]
CRPHLASTRSRCSPTPVRGRTGSSTTTRRRPASGCGSPRKAVRWSRSRTPRRWTPPSS